jgi:hypothetical protein
MARGGRLPLLAAALLLVMAANVTGASASTWTVNLAAANHGHGQAQALPAAPAATATCSGLVLGSIIITWTAVSPPETTYTIYKSTTSATTGFSTIATGVSGTTFTVSGLAIASYWFTVQGVAGANWMGSMSAATVKRSITLVLCS